MAGTRRKKEQDDENETGRKREKYVLRLYVTGMTPKSTRAIQNIQAICEEHLKGRYELQVIDIYQRPELASGEQILAAPTLIKKLPAPLRQLVGDLSHTDRVLLGLDLRDDTDPKSRRSPKPRTRKGRAET